MQNKRRIQWNRPLKKTTKEDDHFEEVAGWILAILMGISYTAVAHIVLTALFG
ncbi:hypothetical protein [Lactobacillus intestinalis]|uniref:hypothetical protein n=1 Tax=Lactobacillus intestinalis TaxID=151781 RepID=UPI0002CB2632|nr:hypothetical protein [Lactobacillus intestinalis]KAI4309883.1 hypothetical protein C821_001609 [Lactobacillus intestinalis]